MAEDRTSIAGLTCLPHHATQLPMVYPQQTSSTRYLTFISLYIWSRYTEMTVLDLTVDQKRLAPGLPESWTRVTFLKSNTTQSMDGPNRRPTLATPDHLGKSTLRVDATEYHGVFTKQLGIERVQVCT